MGCCNCTSTLYIDKSKDSTFYGGESAGGVYTESWAPIGGWGIFCNCQLVTSTIGNVPGYPCHRPNTHWRYAYWDNPDNREVYKEYTNSSHTCPDGYCAGGTLQLQPETSAGAPQDINLGYWNAVSVFARYRCKVKQKWYNQLICGTGPWVDGPIAKAKFKFAKKIERKKFNQEATKDHYCGQCNDGRGCACSQIFTPLLVLDNRSSNENRVTNLQMPAQP